MGIDRAINAFLFGHCYLSHSPRFNFLAILSRACCSEPGLLTIVATVDEFTILGQPAFRLFLESFHFLKGALLDHALVVPLSPNVCKVADGPPDVVHRVFFL